MVQLYRNNNESNKTHFDPEYAEQLHINTVRVLKEVDNRNIIYVVNEFGSVINNPSCRLLENLFKVTFKKLKYSYFDGQ